VDWAKHTRRILVRLGEDATVIGATTVTARGIYSAPYQRLGLGIDGGIASSNPRFTAMTADLPATPTAVVTSRGTHNISDIQPDDPGGLTVFELFDD